MPRWKHIGYSLTLFLLRGLVYLKRALFFAGRQAFGFFQWIEKQYRDILGFRLYKIYFFFKRRFDRMMVPLRSGTVDIIGRRGVLQLLVFIVRCAVSLPHTRILSAETKSIPGRGTLLYQLVGPGDEEGPADETLEEVPLLLLNDQRGWREGAVSAEFAGTESSGSASLGEQGFSRISIGGTALTKPTIAPGAFIPGVTEPARRTEIILYAVQPGDVISKIAETYGVSVETILWANGLTVRSYIRPGDTLKILPITGVVHAVKRGDTLGKIAQAYGVPLEEIISANTLSADGSGIKPGQELLIPNGRIRQAAPAPVRRYTALSNVAAPPPSAEAPAGSGYLWPTAARRISQYFGWRHTAVDVAGPVGTAIYASRAGTVIKSQNGWNGGYGNYIILDHGDGVQTLYGHNSKLLVSVGEYVSQGQTISLMGSTGRSTGPHVHFEVRVSGKRQNPLRYVR